MTLPRRRFLHLAAGAVMLPAVSRIARAQAYPARPVRIVVGFTPAGATDILARLIGQWLSERLGQTFIVENRPGAGSNIGTEAVVRAPADGYTLLLVAPANAINATLYDKLNFNFIRDIAPVAGLIRVANVMEVNPSLPAKTLPEFIAYAKANPGKVNYGSAGTGSQQHVAGELFKMMAGIDMVHVPYRGGGPALADLMGGQVQLFFGTTASTIELHQERQAARAGGDHRDALAGAAGRSDRGRVRAGLRGELVVRHRRAQEHARRDHRQAQQGDQCRPRRSQDQGRLADMGGTALTGSAGRVRQADRRRDREVGQGGEGLRREGEVTPSTPASPTPA